MRKLFVIAVTAIFLSIPTISNAQLEEATGDETQLDTVVVSASRVPETLRETTRQMTIITEEEILESNGTDISDVLEKHGIEITREGTDNYGNVGIAMRGGTSSMHGLDLGGDILVLVDGRRSATDFLSGFDKGNIRRIEVIHGPGSVQYGSAAIGGVINILTKRGTETPQARLELGIGSWGESKAKAASSGMIGNFDLAGSITFSRRHSATTPDGETIYNSDLPGRTTYSVNIGYNIDDENRIGVLVHGSDTSDTGKGPYEAGAAYTFTRQKRNDVTVDLLYEGARDKMSWLVRYFRGVSKMKLSRFYTAQDARRIFSTTDDKFQGAQAQFSAEFGNFSFVTGVDWMGYDIEQYQYVSYATEAQSKLNNISFFFLGKYKIIPEYNFEFSAGVRYDKFDVKVDSKSTNNIVRHVDTSFSKWNPTAGLTFSPTSFLKLRASYGYGFKAPLPRQIGGFTYMMATPYVGNPNLKPEESQNVEVGFEIEYEGLFVNGTYFSSKFKNMIISPLYEPGDAGYDSSYNPGGNYYLYENAQKATVRGFEIGASYDLGRHFNNSFKLEPYFHWTRLTKFINDDTNMPLVNRARDTISFGVDFTYDPADLYIGLSGVRHGTLYTDASPTSGFDPPIHSSVVLNLDIRKTIFTFGDYGKANLKVAVRNITNEEYEFATPDSRSRYQYATMPGRSFYVALEYAY